MHKFLRRTNILKDKLIRYWQIAPGESAKLWDDFLKNRIAAVGWDEIGIDLKDKSKEEILKLVQQKYPENTEPSWQPFPIQLQLADMRS